MTQNIASSYGVIPGLIALIFTHEEADNESERINSSEFEAKLNNFDTKSHFYSELLKRESDNIIDITYVDDAKIAEKIISAFKDDYNDSGAMRKHIGEEFDNIMVIKLAYGTGAKTGSEQLGFTKSYRPFIRLLSGIKNINSKEVLWQDHVLVFGDKSRRGSDADAENVPRTELLSALKMLTQKSIAMLGDSLNGETLPTMPNMGQENKNDFQF